MSKKSPIALVATAGVLALAALIWMFAPPGEPGASGSVRPGAESAAEAPRAPGDLANVGGGPGQADLADVPPSGEPAGERVAARAEPDAREGNWLRGRVQFPLGTPADERVLVLSVDRPRKLSELVTSPDLVGMAWDPERQRVRALLSTAEVEPDGSFWIELPAGARSAHLALAGRYLFSMATTAVRLPARQGVTLTGELGAWVSGTLRPPPDPSPLQSDFEWIEVELGPDITAGLDTTRMDSLGVTRKVEAAADGAFEFRGIPGAGAYGISVEHGHLAALLQLGVDPEPGEHLVLDVQMVRGATLRGRVFDGAGAAVAEAEVEARYRGAIGDAIGTLRKTVTEADGSFELAHVATGKIDLTARSEGLLEDRLKLEDELFDGLVLGGLTLELGGGTSIEGWVRFDDGAPAEGAEVRASADLSQLGGLDAMKVVQTRGGKTETDASGHFTLTGLSASRFRVDAVLHVEDGGHAGTWRATAKSVEPDGEALQLVLEELVAMRGRVVDSTGAPVPSFEVRATLQGSGAMFGIGAERRGETVADEADGSFTMAGLSQAVWEVEVDADGFATSATQEVSLPQSETAPELLFTLEPAAAVAGRVLDTADTPVAGARVTLELDLGSRMEASQGEGVPEVYTDVEGAFLMEGLDPGSILLVASFEGFAGSEPVGCEVASGEVTEGVELRLRVGGTLTGLVYDDEGAPAAGRMVIVQHAPSFASQHMLSTDGEGAFRIEHLEPGSWQVVSTENFMSGDSSLTDEDADMGEFLGTMKMSAAEIVDGEETHVVLGAPPADPVDLRGRVTHLGEPVPNAMVSLVPEGLEGVDAMGGIKMKVTDESGAFALRLDQPGDYLFTVQSGVTMGSQNSVEFLEHVPEGVETHEVEVELPGGRISGRVRGPDGAPLPGCRITVNVEGGVALGSMMGGNYVEMKTDAEGVYVADYLREGTYTVAAGGVPLGGLLGEDGEGGRSVRGGVRLAEGQRLDSVDFDLQEAVELSGRVLDPSGAPVSGASVFVRDDSGRLLERFSLLSTDGAGRFTYAGLTPGRYRVSARKGDQVSEESAPVSVAPGLAGDVVVTLVQGTVIVVVVLDESGAELRATISVTDPEGRELAGMLSMGEVMESFGQGFSSKEQRIGPLPDGKYTVTAVHADGRKKTRSVQLRGQGERKLKLRLK